jgi:predicted transcriptional regulator
MRTTLTLDDDVVTQIERLRKARDASLKDVVNEALREGLRHMTSPPSRRAPFRTACVDLGRCLVSNVDNVAEVLAVADSESFR